MKPKSAYSMLMGILLAAAFISGIALVMVARMHCWSVDADNYEKTGEYTYEC